MRKSLLSKITMMLVMALLLSVSSMAQDHIVYDFATDGDTEGWGSSGTILVVSGGQLTVTMKEDVGYPGIDIEGLGLDASVFTEFEITFTNTTGMNLLQLFRLDETGTKGAEKIEFTSVGNIQETITIAMPTDGQATIPGLFLRFKQAKPAPTTGAFVVDQIRLLSLNAGGTTYDLTTNVIGGGSVIPSSGSFPENSVQTITAIPAFGYSFTTWGGDLSGSTNPESLTMDGNKTVTATFTAVPDFDYTWNFNTDGDTEEWVATQSTATVASGILTMAISSNLPKLTRSGLGVPAADLGVLEIRMKNNTPVNGASDAGDVMRFLATTTEGANVYFNLDDANMGAGVVTGNDTEFKTYEIPFGNRGAYEGLIETYTFIGPRNQTSGSVEIDYIKLLGKQDQTITFGALDAKQVGDPDFELSATTDSGLPVSYTSSDETVVTISESTVTIIGAGSVDITASQSGNAYYYPANEVVQTLTVTEGAGKVDQTITFEALPSKILGGAPFELTATASSGLTVSYSSSDETVATIEGSTVTILGVGTTEITASQAGNETFNPAVDVSQTLTVTSCDDLAASAVGSNLSCFESGDGSIDLTVTGGSGNYTVLWSSGQDTEDLSNLAAGEYSVTVTDAGGCTATTSVTLSQPDEIVLTAIITNSTTVAGNGAIDATVSGGASPYSFAWSSGEETEDISGLMAGIYTLTVTDANTCSASENFEISGVTAVEFETNSALSLYPNPVNNRLNIEYDGQLNNAHYTIYSLNGLIVKQGLVSAKKTLIDCEDLQDGSYILLITDGNHKITQKLIKK